MSSLNSTRMTEALLPLRKFCVTKSRMCLGSVESKSELSQSQALRNESHELHLKIRSPSLKFPRVLIWRYFLYINKKSVEARRRTDGCQGDVKGEQRVMNLCKCMYTNTFECMHISGQIINCLL